RAELVIPRAVPDDVLLSELRVELERKDDLRVRERRAVEAVDLRWVPSHPDERQVLPLLAGLREVHTLERREARGAESIRGDDVVRRREVERAPVDLEGPRARKAHPVPRPARV